MSEPDAITILIDDHNRVKKLFKEFQGLGDRALKTKQTTVSQISEELAVHAYIEEQVFYPRIREQKEVEDDVLEALEEHHSMKQVLAEIDAMNPEDERFDAKVTVLIEEVEHHVEEEEEELFPAVRRLFDKDVLTQLGSALQTSRLTAPRHADPDAPDEPPSDQGHRAT